MLYVFFTVPGAELFTIKMHYAIGMVERFAGFVDFCSLDQISRIELLAMAREFSLDVTNCKMWWLDVSREPSELREIRDDMDALNMANSVSSPREVYVLLRILNSGPVEMNNEGQEESGASDTDLVDLVISSDRKVNRNDEDLEFHDSDYEFSSESTRDEVDTNMTARAMVVVDGEPPKSVNEPHSESDYADADEFQSCSSTDEEEIISKRPNYSEFNEQCDMSNPQFKIGMKFSSFKQFKDVVRNYGIRNRYVLNFKPNSQGPMIPPQPISKRRGRKKMLRRKELGEETKGFTNGRVSKKGVTNKCSICGATGHNKRFHGGVKVSNMCP